MSFVFRGGFPKWFVLCAGLISLLAAAGAASAGDIVGMAADATGAVLPAAQVTLRNLATGEEQFAQADLEGKFRFSGVRAGSYLITVESPGFSRDSRTVAVDRISRTRGSEVRPRARAGSKWA